MNNIFSKSIIERYSRQIILKDIGPKGQKNIIKSKVLIIGAGGLGCPIIDYLSRAGVNNIGIADHDKVSLSNLHRQNFYDLSDLGKFKVEVVRKKIKKINNKINLKIYKNKIINVKFDTLVKPHGNISSSSIPGGANSIKRCARKSPIRNPMKDVAALVGSGSLSKTFR